MKSQVALVGIFNEFCFIFLMSFVALKLYSHWHAGSDVVQTAFLNNFKAWKDISLGILFSWKLWLFHLYVNRAHHTEYQYLLVGFQSNLYLCYWVGVCKHCIMYFSVSYCYALWSVWSSLNIFPKLKKKFCLQFILFEAT